MFPSIFRILYVRNPVLVTLYHSTFHKHQRLGGLGTVGGDWRSTHGLPASCSRHVSLTCLVSCGSAQQLHSCYESGAAGVT